jgi:O-succinylbenzoic acid--CoA ligase
VSSSFLRTLPGSSSGGAGTAGVAGALQDTLDGGPPIAPLPDDASEAERVLAMLQPEAPVTEPDAAAIVATSGSTGQPKGAVLSRSAITASAQLTHNRLDGPGRWLLALPVHYVAGLMVIARSVVAGMPLVEIGSDLTELPDAVRRPAGQPCYLSLVPTQLARALRDPELTTALSHVDTVLLGGGPASAELLHQAASAGVRVMTTYGMSETCGGCVYDGVPLDAVDVSLAPQTGDTGRISIGGPTVFSGYRLRPDLTEQTLIGGSVQTNDRGELTGGRLRVLGRFDDVIVSGGLKVDVAAVEASARSWPDLDGGDIAMIGVPDPDWGSKLVAYAEAPHGDSEPNLERLRAHLDDRIARRQQPKELVWLPQLPRTAGGKIDRRRLAARHRAPTAQTENAAATALPEEPSR